MTIIPNLGLIDWPRVAPKIDLGVTVSQDSGAVTFIETMRFMSSATQIPEA